MEKVKKALSFTVFGTLFLSMFFSFMIQLAQNIEPVKVNTQFSLSAQSEVFIFDEDELELVKEHKAKILMEKNVIPAAYVESFYEVIKHEMTEPQTHLSTELSKDIFYPPKHVLL